MRQFSFIDRVIGELDAALQTLTGRHIATRSNPAAGMPESSQTDAERQDSAGLMRVNHTGEVCAQALYRGQQVWAKTAGVREFLAQAAAEETDHLAWCEARLSALQSRPSYLNVFWYGASFGLGVVASRLGDRWSLGFVAETEQQVGAHLQSHLAKMAKRDIKSAAVITQMYQDEVGHGQQALQHGGQVLPQAVRYVMTKMAQVMKVVAYRI